MLPLLSQYAPNQAIYVDATRRIDRTAFTAMVHSLAPHLPKRDAILNLCDDRLFFLLGFCAALIRHCPTLLPGNRTDAGLTEILPAFPRVTAMHDGPPLRRDLPHLRLDQLALTTSGKAHTLELHADIIAATLFTSGSTGVPQAHTKTWGMLASAATLLRTELGICGTILGSVPPQHMFGLETTVLLPMEAGLTVAGGCPLLPHDIHSAMQTLLHGPDSPLHGPLWWMTTPLHLRACVQSGLRFPKLTGGMVCATQTLSPELAAAAESCFQAPLHEIYGCTEAGMIGLRRPAHESTWRLCQDWEMTQANEHTWICGPRAGGSLRLHDHISLLPDRRFALHGRHAQLVKVGGKRVHIDALNQALLSVPGVQDGVFFQPEEGGRLTAFVVMDSFDRGAILTTLRQRIDPVFLPRPLHRVAALPRTTLGKLPLAALLDLALQHTE